MDLAVVVTLAAAGGVGLYGLACFNRMVALRSRCEQAFGDIDVQLKQRHDQTQQLVEIVRGYALHERSVLEAVVRARAAAMRAPDGDTRMAAESRLGDSVGSMLALAEKYPQLQASAQFTGLREELVDIEHKLAAARRFLNMAVAEHNAALEQVPGRLIASVFAFRRKQPFDLGFDRMLLEDPPQLRL